MSKPTNEPVPAAQRASKPADFYIIGIGSSNGGLEPLKIIVAGLPADIPAAVIIVHHGLADAPLGLAQILQDITSLPVIEVKKEEQIRPGQVFVPPPGQRVILRDQVLKVEGVPVGGKPKIIDTCFRTLAYEGREKCICVILSGAGYDGVEGAKIVELHGGVIIVQDPATAMFPLMPVSIIANDDPNLVLKPEEISQWIADQLGR